MDDPWRETLAATQQVIANLAGMRTADATAIAAKAGLTVRVLGPEDPTTADWSARRANFVVEDGIVIEAFAG